MDTKLKKAIEAIEAGREYDLNGHRCKTLEDVDHAWKDESKPAVTVEDHPAPDDTK